MGGLVKFADTCDAFNKRLGKALSYLILLLILVQFAIVVLAANFQIGSIKLQESVLYINALMFLGAAGYTFLKDGHVRVDIFYRGKTKRGKAWTDLIGTLVLLVPFLVFVWWIGVPFVVNSWSNMEGSYETSGLQIVYILKSFVLLFAFSLTLQAFSLIVRNVAVLKGGKR